ncbi:hypothetical protein ACFY9F_22130 [Streptomyces sp. NPDC012421]|uniref:HAAS signaling domain-containing protein n=1 Tax=Streptomyces sp. NPDC012421 TaxID=3364832 RepID=UPI0036E894C7
MTTSATDHPLVAASLDSVARETAALPADRRAELLADLREHIEVSDARDEAGIRAVLAELGDRRTVAASALAEADAVGRPAQAHRHGDGRGRAGAAAPRRSAPRRRPARPRGGAADRRPRRRRAGLRPASWFSSGRSATDATPGGYSSRAKSASARSSSRVDCAWA